MAIYGLVGTLLFCISLTALTYCTSLPKNSAQEHGVHCYYEVPVIKRDYSVELIKTWYDVFYSGSFVLYIFPETRLDLQGQPSFKTYLICHKDSLYGRRFSEDDKNPFNGERIQIDSAKSLFEFNNESLQEALKGLTPDSIRIVNSNELVKVFSIPTSEKYPEKFKVYLYYSSLLAKIQYSIAPQLDTVPNKKLYRISNVGLGHYYEKEKMNMPAREYIQKMTIIDLPIGGLIDSLSNLYQKP